ncbi:MAG: pyridoxal-phosphate dependent enzyme [Bacteroidales bacterium]
MSKYKLTCKVCGYEVADFSSWFSLNQVCPKCGSKHVEANYTSNYNELPTLLKETPKSFWHYFDFLPLINPIYKVSLGEGAIPIENWDFLSQYAKEKYNIDCTTFVYRNDLNGGTQSFKDVAAALAASVLSENGVKQYCLASTGNAATAFSKYLSLAGINVSVFVPQTMSLDSEIEMRAYGQQVIRVKGNYAYAKQMAAEYSQNNKILLSAGNIDPMRIEAKKTMVFEFLRQLGKIPEVYIQAVAGGTGPLAIDKGIREIAPYFNGLKNPRMLLIQQDLCDPMVQAWETAKSKGFPKGFQKEYPIIENPSTSVSILSTGNPGMYPLLAPLVKNSEGDFLRVKENQLGALAKIVAFEKKVLLGPASLVCMLGFFQALKNGAIKNGESVLINTGEGANRSTDFVRSLMPMNALTANVADCHPHQISDLRKQLWENLDV